MTDYFKFNFKKIFVTVECQFCGKVKRRKVYSNHKNRIKFCSDACRHKFNREQAKKK